MFKQKKLKMPLYTAADHKARSEDDHQKKARLIKQLKHDAILKTSFFAASVIISFTLIFGITAAPSNDMFPAVHEGDIVIYFRPGRIVNTDIVIYQAPDGSMQIGRVEGTEGQTIGKSDGGLLTVNGNIQPVQNRRGIYEETYTGTVDLQGEIGPGQYLVLGDHREDSTDSRSFGLISRKAIKGKAFTLIRRRPL